MGAFFFSLTAAAVKWLPATVGVEVKVLFRACVAMIVTGAVIWRKKESIVPHNKKILALRSVLGATAMFGFFTAVTGMPLSEAITLSHLSPFFVALLAALFLKERLYRAQIVAVLLAFVGAVLVVRPGMIPFTGYAVLAVSTAVLAGGAHVSLRALRKTDSPQVIVFWFSTLLCLVALPIVLVRATLPTWVEVAVLVGLGLGGTLGQLCMTAAYRHAPGGEVAIYNYLGVAFSMLWQISFWGDPLNPLAVAGALLIVGGAYLNLRAGRKRAGRKRAGRKRMGRRSVPASEKDGAYGH
jgi:drug/metabolite transporter (DMT)-like permease